MAALRIQSGQPVIALARTLTLNNDGSPGTFGALETPVATADFLQASDTATYNLNVLTHTQRVRRKNG